MNLFNNHLGMLLTVILVYSALHAVNADPKSLLPVRCKEDSHCFQGFYCESLTQTCQQCLQCTDKKRQDPQSYINCIKSVVLCGPCMKGYVEDSSGDVSASCVIPEKPFNFTWVVIIAFIVLFLIIGLIILYVLREKVLLKIHAGTRTTLETPHLTAVATAPELPPPYYPQYDVSENSNGCVNLAAPRGNELGRGPFPYRAERSVSPSDPYTLDEVSEARRPFIKRASPPPVPQSPVSSAQQAARVFNRPVYERDDSQNIYETDATNDASDHDGLASLHDEETVQSPWVPYGENTNVPKNDDIVSTNIVEGAASTGTGSLSVLMASARGTVLVRPPPSSSSPPAKKKCTKQESNNSGNRSAEETFASNNNNNPRQPPTNSITLNVQVNTIQHHGESNR